MSTTIPRSPLLVPRSLYAPFSDARKAAGRFVTALGKGQSITVALGAEMVAVTPDRPGLLVLDRKLSQVPANEPQFHLDLPWSRLFDALYKKDAREAFERGTREALDHPWSFIGLVGGEHYSVVRAASAHLRFLEAANACWPALATVGARYTWGFNVGWPLERMNTLVSFCLARQGAPATKILPLTPARLAEQVEHLPGFRIRALLEAGEVKAAVSLLEGHEDISLCSLAEHFFAFHLEDVACEAVERYSRSDPHGIVREWLEDRGDLARTVR